MLDDFFSSSSGPGVLGIVIGTVVLAGFCGLGFVAFQSAESPLGDSLAEQVRRGAGELEDEQRSVQRVRDVLKRQESFQRGRQRLADRQREFEQLSNEEAEIQGCIDEAQLALESLITDWEDYRQAYRDAEWERAKGEEIDLSADFGEGWEKARIREITDHEIKFRLPTGAKGIPYEELPEHLKDRFQFSDELAQARREELQRRQEAYFQGIQQWEEGLKSRGASAEKHGGVAGARRRVRQLRQRSKMLCQQAQQWENRAEGLDEKRRLARSEGRITVSSSLPDTLRARAVKNRQQAQSLEQQAQRLEMGIREKATATE